MLRAKNQGKNRHNFETHKVWTHCKQYKTAMKQLLKQQKGLLVNDEK